MKPLLLAVTTLSAFLSGAAISSAQSQMPDLSEIVEISLLKGWRQENGVHLGAVKITLAPGWKTYWRVGGETGIPPRFDWQGSINLDTVRYHWPRPGIFTADGVQIIGYKDQLILPVAFSAANPYQAITANLSLEIGVCRDVCIPVQATLSSDLTARSDEARAQIEQSLAKVTQDAQSGGVVSATCSLSPINDGYRLTTEIILPAASAPNAVVVVEAPLKDVWIAPSTSHRSGDHLSVETSLISYADASFSVDLASLTTTIISHDQSIEIIGCTQSN